MMIRSQVRHRVQSARCRKPLGAGFSHHQKYSEAGGNPLNRFPPALFTEQINRSNQSDGYVIQRSWLITCICGTTLTAPHPQRRTQTRRVADAHVHSTTSAMRNSWCHVRSSQSSACREQHHTRSTHWHGNTTPACSALRPLRHLEIDEAAFWMASEDASLFEPESRMARIELLMVTVLCASSSATE